MSITATEYETLRAWSAMFIERVLPVPAGLPAESRPIAILDGMALNAPGRARQGLGMMIGDFIEDTSHLPVSQVKHIDAEFTTAGLPTLSAMRLRFMRQIKRIVKRGSISNEEEYYLIGNAVEGVPNDEKSQLWQMLADYEARSVLTK
ncbi:hypothetical protein BH09PSE3_BH09PSE3_08320 [soil metagenome]